MDWKKLTTLIVVGLMVLSMIIYVATLDESDPDAPVDVIDPAAAQKMEADQPAGPEQGQPVPAAAE